jgi:hypothetical protein
VSPGLRVRARVGIVALFLAFAVLSTLRTLPDTWSFLSGQRSSYADLTAAQPNVVPQFQSLVPVEAGRFFFAHLRRGDRYYLLAEEGTFFAGVDHETAVRTFGRFYLLPAVAVRDPADAEVVLAIGADPRDLDLRYAEVVRAPGGRYAFARVTR